MTGRSARAVAVCAPILLVAACGSGFSGAIADGMDAGPADASPDVTAADAGCDATQSPKTNACVVTDAYGVFVAPNGSDSATGTMSAPFATVGRGVLAAASAHKRVYVCTGTYAEQVTIDASANGVSLFGGLACPGDDAGDSSWSYTGHPATIAPTTGYALKVDTVSSPIVIEDLELAATDATTPGGSSIAAFVNGSANVDFVRVELSAGSGADAAMTPALSGQPATTTNGNAGTTSGLGDGTGGAAVTCSCTNGGMTTGGAGGNGGPMTAGAGSPGSAMPTVTGSPPADGAGGPAGCYAGHNGGAAPGGSGGGGAMSLGTLTSNGWTPATGTGGSNGGPGEGGGGGGGDALSPANGGACGGCGGAGGGPGAGGGSSIALAIVMSTVTLDSCSLVASHGGAGGKGGAGQAGGLGGTASSAETCLSGGTGGAGGAGGAGGGGAGGSSWGVAFVGTAPTQMNGTTISIGALGGGGAGGEGMGMNGDNGMNGDATEVKSF